MPELPEVETLRRSLQRHVVDSRIECVSVANPKVLKGQSEAEFRQRVVGKRIAAVMRRGKYLLAPLVAPEPSSLHPPDAASLQLCIHLNMRGQLAMSDGPESVDPHQCVRLQLSGGRFLRYRDLWGWGEVRALTDEEIAHRTSLSAMGPEPLENGWSDERLAARRTAIKAALLDQRVIAGVGNIYADEALHRARIHPRRQASTLTAAERAGLAAALRSVLSEAVAGGGSRGEFRSLEGVAGSYVPQVYDRGGFPCPRCGAVLERIRLGGRGTVFCPRCQEESPGTNGESYSVRRKSGKY